MRRHSAPELGVRVFVAGTLHTMAAAHRLVADTLTAASRRIGDGIGDGVGDDVDD